MGEVPKDTSWDRLDEPRQARKKGQLGLRELKAYWQRFAKTKLTFFFATRTSFGTSREARTGRWQATSTLQGKQAKQAKKAEQAQQAKQSNIASKACSASKGFHNGNRVPLGLFVFGIPVGNTFLKVASWLSYRNKSPMGNQINKIIPTQGEKLILASRCKKFSAMPRPNQKGSKSCGYLQENMCSSIPTAEVLNKNEIGTPTQHGDHNK